MLKMHYGGCFMTYSNSKILLKLFTIVSALAFLEMAQADSPYPGSTTIFVNYANAATNPNLDKSPTVHISFNGSDHYVPFIMDTGSVGIIASEDIFQPAPDAKNLGEGRQFYTSSGIIEEGTWWSSTQNIYDANGTLLATSDVPVLQVKKIRCSKHARECHNQDNPSNIAVMGIGFGRESKTQPRGTPPYNPFLNLQSVLQGGVLRPLPADWCNGYVVTPTGVYLGLTSLNTTNAGWVKLLPWSQYSTPTLPEWMPATMTITANGVGGPGNILMDTGVDTAFFVTPPNVNLGPLVQCPDSTLTECVGNGNVIGVYLPNQASPTAFYTFTVGETGNLMQPDGVHVVGGSKTFFNTSRHILGGINFIYDNSNGYIGYIWNGLSGSNVGYVIPATAISTTTLTTSATPVAFGKNVKFTATVVGDNPSVLPTGTVTFFIDNKPQSPVELDSHGTATFSTSTLPPISHTIQAKYSGDFTYIRSTSPSLTQKIKPPTCF